MFGWFAPKCPLDTWEKTWTETRMVWLASRLGLDRLKKAIVVLPTTEFFPAYEGQVKDVRSILDRLCFYMALDPLRLDLQICQDNQMPLAAGHYVEGPRATIRVAESQLGDPARLIATLAHELAHEILLSGKHLSVTDWDHEWITDLLPVFLGLGIFGANAALYEDYSQYGHFSSWVIGKQGYLPSRIFGYALALFAIAREEQQPDWADHLRLDALAAFRSGIRYVRKTGDSVFRAGALDPTASPSSEELVRRMDDASPSTRLAAVWEAAECGLSDSNVIAALIRRLDDRDHSIPGEAARVLAELNGPVLPAAPRLIRALQDKHPAIRSGAAAALGRLGVRTDQVLYELAHLLEDPDIDVVCSAAWAIGQFGPQAEKVVPRLLPALHAALVQSDHALMDALTAALCAITSEARQHLRRYFGKDDADLRRQALALLQSPGRLQLLPPRGAGCRPQARQGTTVL